MALSAKSIERAKARGETGLRERDIEDYLVKRVKSRGGEVRKLKWIGRKSAPDRVVMLPMWVTPNDCGDPNHQVHDSRLHWVELKPPGGRATFPKNAHERAQAREHERMRAVGQHVVVIDSFAGVDALLA